MPVPEEVRKEFQADLDEYAAELEKAFADHVASLPKSEPKKKGVVQLDPKDYQPKS